MAKGLLGKTTGKHLYEMEIDADDILHRADLRIYDEIVEALKQNKKCPSACEGILARN
jgi:hypothetical protein